VLLPAGAGAQRAGAATTRSTTSTQAVVVFHYNGIQSGYEDFYGFISVSRPYAKTGHLDWEYNWDMTCSTKIADLVVGSQIGCGGPVTISGWEKRTFTDPVLGEDCTAKFTTRKGAEWALGAYVRNKGTVLLNASPPRAELASVPDPPGSTCIGPDDAIDWREPAEISKVVRGKGSFFVAYGPAKGDYVDTSHGRAVRGHTWGMSGVEMVLEPEKSFSRQVGQILVNTLANLADDIARSLDGARDRMNADVPLSELLPPSTDLGTSGTLTGSGSPATRDLASGRAAAGTLFTINQRVRSGFTRVPIRLSAAGRQFLQNAGTAKVRIGLTFNPADGKAVRVQRVVKLSPPLAP